MRLTHQKRLHRLVTNLFCLCICLWLGACTAAPFTGRSQLILISADQEAALGLKSYRQVLRESKLSRDEKLISQVRTVGTRIAAASDRSDFEWEFNVIEDDKTANAFCLPGGKVAIYTGILPYTKDENGLATVISHEVAHAIARHGAERMTTTLIAQIGHEAMHIAIREQSGMAIQAASMAYGVGAQIGFILPFSRTHELEADRIGLILMARAGYDPGEAIAFWQRLSRVEKDKIPAFLSTHPTDETRIRNIKGHLPEALRYYSKRLD
ncbi:MAG: M48 family metallopeptidase [Deltaproteobacteria bacterium]|nr:M48 family metallopeptidase [Deltaproteobacteria bacterium]